MKEIKYILIIDNGIEVENYYFENKKEVIEKYKNLKKYVTSEIEIYKVKKI